MSTFQEDRAANPQCSGCATRDTPCLLALPPPGVTCPHSAAIVGMKLDAGKPRWDLIPPLALEDVARVLEFGARKYAPDNWRKVEGWRWRYLRAGIGHIYSHLRGERMDLESGFPHLAHAICCLLFVLELER